MLLTIRKAQLNAMGDARLKGFRDEVVAILRHHISQDESAPGRDCGLPTGYVEALVDRSIAACEEQGYHQKATVAGIARALWKDDEHPLAAGPLALKVESVMLDQRTRVLYGQHLAARAAMPSAEASNVRG